MAYLRCKECEHYEAIPTAKYRVIGLGVAAFGVFGWFSYLFAGSGNAFLIASVITISGIVCFFSAESIGKSYIIKQRCPKCDSVNWDSIPYNNKR